MIGIIQSVFWDHSEFKYHKLETAKSEIFENTLLNYTQLKEVIRETRKYFKAENKNKIENLQMCLKEF